MKMSDLYDLHREQRCVKDCPYCEHDPVVRFIEPNPAPVTLSVRNMEEISMALNAIMEMQRALLTAVADLRRNNGKCHHGKSNGDCGICPRRLT